MNTLPEFNSLDCAVLLEAGFTPAAVRLFLDTGFSRESVMDAAMDRVRQIHLHSRIEMVSRGK